MYRTIIRTIDSITDRYIGQSRNFHIGATEYSPTDSASYSGILLQSPRQIVSC